MRGCGGRRGRGSRCFLLGLGLGLDPGERLDLALTLGLGLMRSVLETAQRNPGAPGDLSLWHMDPEAFGAYAPPPTLIVDYLTLVGDTVDNVPGVDKCGPKTAAKWLAEYGSLDAIVARAAEIKGVAGENLRKALDWLPTGRKLITVLTDCDLTGHVEGWPALEALALREVDRAGVLDFFQRYGFRTWRKELEEALGEKLFRRSGRGNVLTEAMASGLATGAMTFSTSVATTVFTSSAEIVLS